MTGIGIWDVLVVAAKAVTYAATLGGAGGVFFLAYSHSLMGASNGRRIRRMIGMLLIVSVLASGVKILLTAGSMSGDLSGMFDPSLDKMILQTGEGRACVVRLIGAMCMLSVLTARGRPPVWAVIGSLAAATSFAWVGHVHALSASQLPILVVAVHLLGAAFWLGALVPLLMVTFDADVSRMAAVVSRFGNAALFVVGALLAAGVCLLCILLRDVAELWTSGYGRFILVKVALVACLLSVAALNHMSLTPRLRAHEPLAVAALRRSIRFEIAVAALILIVTAAMTTLTGPSALIPG